MLVTVPTAAGVCLSVGGVTGVMALSLAVTLVAPGEQGVTGDMNAPFGAPSPVRKTFTVLEYCPLLVWVHQGATEAV